MRRPPTGVGVAIETPDHIHRYALYRDALLLGTSNLECAVVKYERASGLFYPERAFVSVSEVFALYRRASARDDDRLLKQYVELRDQLNLSVWRSGERLDATVELISRWDARTYVMHVTSRDDRFWRWRYPDTD